MEYLPKPLRKNSISVKPEKKKITMADLANLKNMMKRFERPGVVAPEAAPDKRGGSAADRRGSMASTSSSSAMSQHSEHSAANLDGLQASLDKQRTMRRSNSTRDIASVLNRSSDPLGSNSMHGSTATMMGAMQRNQMGSNSGFLKRSDHGKDPGDTLDTEGDDTKDALGANSMHGRIDYSSSMLTRRSTARSNSDDGSVVSGAGARSVHSLFSSSALTRRKKSGDDTSVMSAATTGGKRRTRRLSMGSMGNAAPETSTSENMRNNLRSNLLSTGTGPSTNLLELRSGLGLPSPNEKAKAATAIEQAVAASDNGTSSTPTWGGALADLRRSVVSQRALMSASAHNDYDGPKTIMRGMGRRSSVGGMALPPTTLAPQVKKRSSGRSRSRGRSQSVQRSSKSTDESKTSESKSSKKKPRDRSESVQRIGKSTEKSKSSEGKSPTKSSEKRGRGRTSKSSDVPPETKASERKGRGRSRSVHASGKSSSKSSAVPPETKTPDKKARARSKSTQQQRRTSKTTKDQAARQKYGYNEFETDEAAKHEAETAEAAEKEAAEKEAAGSALGRRRERSQSMSHRMITNQETKYEPEDAIKQAANAAVGRRRERSQSISHRRPSVNGLGDATSTPEAEIPPVDSKDVSAFGTAVDHGGFPAWDDKAFSGASETSAPADFGAPAPWDDDPWADEGGNFDQAGDFDQEAPAVTTKVETKPNVPAIINFGDSNDLFGSEQVGLGSSSGHSRGGGSASGHSGGGGSSGSGSVSSGRGAGKQRSLSKHMDTSFGGKPSDGGSVVSGRSRNNLQGIRRSNVVSAVGPSIGQAVLAVPATKRRSSMTGSGFGGFDTSDVKSVGFDDHFEDKAGGADCPVTSLAPPVAIAFAGTQKLDADSSHKPATNTGQPVPPPSVATLFAQKLDAAKKSDQARGGAQHLPMADSGQDADSNQVLVADSATENLDTANKLDEIKMSQRLSLADSGPDQARGGSERPLKGDSGKGIAEKFQAAKQADEIRKASNAPKLTTASAFAAKLQAARQDDSIACSPGTKKSSVSSASPQKIHRRQSMEMSYSPRPDNTAKKMDGARSNMKHLRRSSLV